MHSDVTVPLLTSWLRSVSGEAAPRFPFAVADVPSNQEVAAMASPGDRIIIRGRTVESPDRHGEITEVRGADGGPPYYVRFDDGHMTLVYPGTDFIIEQAGAH